MEKRERIKKWFFIQKTEKYNYLYAVPFIFTGLILFLIPAVLAALLTTSVGVGIVFYISNKINRFESLPSDVQMDHWLNEDINLLIKNRPYDKLGISEKEIVSESLLVVGPVYWNVNGFDINDVLMKKGKDGFNRFSIWTIQVFMFTENYLCSYKCHYNWIKNTYINESTNEFFYKDVVSVKTDTVSSAYTLINGQRLVHSEAFQLKLAGDEITVITNDISLNTSSIMASKAEKAVQSIRAMLRDKKK